MERTSVTLTFERDGAFVLDVANDPAWLKLRMESVEGPFIDRIVLWVDGREIRPESVELIPPPEGAESVAALATHRLRGHVPLDAKTLRWFYGLVIDPYAMTIRRADGRIVVEEIQGNAWSKPIDLSGQFKATDRWPLWAVLAMLVAAIGIRLRARIPKRRQR